MRGNKPAFTLAEVLITLGIIGVVAAMTMPSLINQTQNKELHTQFKKAYSELNQVSQKFYADEGISIPEYVSTYDIQPFMPKFMSYYAGASKTSDHTWNSTDADGNPTKAPYKLRAFKGSNEAGIVCDVSGYRTEVGGRIFLFNDLPAPNTNGPVLCMDINGYKKPNRWGYDYFMFTFTTDGMTIPMGMEHKNNAKETNMAYNFFVSGSEYCKNSTSYWNQYACANYALADEHPTIKGKNYWQDFLGKN